MKKMTKLLIGCLLLLILFCLLTVCLTFIFWKRIFEFVDSFLNSAGINVSNVSLEVIQKILSQ